MKRAEDYIIDALKAAKICGSIPQAVHAGSQFGKAVAAEVMAREIELDQRHGAHRLGLEDAFQHALNLAPVRSLVQVFLDAALSALTNGLGGRTP